MLLVLAFHRPDNGRRMRTAVNAPTPSQTADFFVAGGTLRADAPSYVPRQADDDLYAALSSGEFCYVLTSRQMGKSSLMARTAQRLRDADVTPVVLDLTAIGQNLTPEQWYAGLLSRLGRAVDLEDELEDFWYDHEHRGPMQRWVDAIEQVVFPRISGPIVVFVDEIDMVRNLLFSTNEFFAGIRECYTRRAEDEASARLTFCLVGVATPSDLIDDPRVTPFNIGRRIELTDFTDDEALRLSDGLGRADDVSSRLMRRVLHWTGGHPYLTQRLSQAVAADASVAGTPGVDSVCAELFFSERAQEQDSNLQFVRNQMLDREEVDSAALLTLYRDVLAGKAVPHDETTPLVNVLQLSGIARVAEGRMHTRNRIYAHVFDDEWARENTPEAELERQRQANQTLLALLYATADQANQAREAEATAREVTARSQIERGVQLLEDGNDLGLLYLVEARENAPEGSPLRGSAERLWAGWHEPYRDRLSQVIDVVGPADVKFSADGKILAVASSHGSVHLFDASTGGRPREPLDIDAEATTLAFSPDGRFLAAGGAEGNIHLWDAQTWTLIPAGFRDYLNHGAESADGLLVRRYRQEILV
jgi:hypothetical protein